MLKEILAGVGLIFVGLPPSVKGNEGLWGSYPSDEGLADLAVSFKENCPDRQGPLFCFFWAPNDLTDLQPTNSFAGEPLGPATAANKPPGKDAQGEGSPETFVEFPESHPQKRFLVARRKNPTPRGYKRGPGFRSWGGKRDSLADTQNVEKRTKFGPWGGKRGGEYLAGHSASPGSGERTEKRARFQNWGGKRGSNHLARGPQSSDVSIKRGFFWKDRFYLDEPFKKAVPKRPQFQSWGGKRAPYPWTKMFGFSNPQSPGYAVSGGEKRIFSSWGGKRQENNGDDLGRDALRNWDGENGGSSAEGTSTRKSFFNDNAITAITTVHNYWKNGQPPSTYDACHDKGRNENNHR